MSARRGPVYTRFVYTSRGVIPIQSVRSTYTRGANIYEVLSDWFSSGRTPKYQCSFARRVRLQIDDDPSSPGYLGDLHYCTRKVGHDGDHSGDSDELSHQKEEIKP